MPIVYLLEVAASVHMLPLVWRKVDWLTLGWVTLGAAIATPVGMAAVGGCAGAGGYPGGRFGLADAWQNRPGRQGRHRTGIRLKHTAVTTRCVTEITLAHIMTPVPASSPILGSGSERPQLALNKCLDSTRVMKGRKPFRGVVTAWRTSDLLGGRPGRLSGQQ